MQQKKPYRKEGASQEKLGGANAPMIIPTNTTSDCILVSFFDDKTRAYPHWQPGLDDLIADDWRVSGKG